MSGIGRSLVVLLADGVEERRELVVVARRHGVAAQPGVRVLPARLEALQEPRLLRRVERGKILKLKLLNGLRANHTSARHRRRHTPTLVFYAATNNIVRHRRLHFRNFRELFTMCEY